uniref:Uncharacterized protein n=1 Tax=Salmo trutta TaxID=8032 RepID=A0A673WVY2_SALTR
KSTRPWNRYLHFCQGTYIGLGERAVFHSLQPLSVHMSRMANITVTHRDGRSKIRFLILSDMLKNAPMLKSIKNQGAGAGRGKAAILKAQGTDLQYILALIRPTLESY